MTELTKQERIRINSYNYYHRDPEKARAKARRWYSKNAEKAKAHTQKWRENNKDKVKANKDAWVQIPENRVRNALTQAKRRAKNKGIDFSISIVDLLPLPEVCPIFGTPINYSGTKQKGFVDDCYSIDRIDATKGYIPGNVRIISWRANRLKSDASLQELELIIKYVRKNLPCD